MEKNKKVQWITQIFNYPIMDGAETPDEFLNGLEEEYYVDNVSFVNLKSGSILLTCQIIRMTEE